MKHIYETIDGWFNFQSVYKNIVASSDDGFHFVEVGSWRGKSASYMAVEIINSNKKIKFDCIDTREGSLEHEHLDIIKNKDLYEIFLKNIENFKNIINPIRLPSIEAAKLYNNNSLDFVFIDASHDYKNVVSDILAWYPKVKNGGIFAGHDYGGNAWPGVESAVNEFIEKNKYELIIQESDCWGIKKNK